MTEQLRDRASRSLPTAAVRHGRLKRHSAWKTLLAVLGGTMAVVLVSGVSVAAIAVNQLNESIDVVELVTAEGEERVIPTVGEWEGGFNVLLVGVDNAEGQSDGDDRGGAVLNDVNILVHVAEDQQSAVAVSIPRDMVVPIPSCPNPEGGSYFAMSAQPINVAMSYGGLSCVVLTVEALTGLDVPYAGIISFDGVARMSSAVGGVDVCVDGPIYDEFTGLNLPEAGTYSLEGRQALAFLRSRKGVGDGSDLGRISSQQVYLSSLIRKVQSEGVLTDVTKLYGLATVATSSMKLSSSLANVDTMVSMALVLKDIPTENITFVQYPGTTGGTGVYSGKVQPIEWQASALLEKIRNDESFALQEGETGIGSALDPNAPAPEPTTPAPTGSAAPTVPPLADEEPAEVLEGVKGQTAADYTCSVAN
ncbi:MULTISPECIES: LCP family protein [Microcella]|uniref:LCP family protein n=1 Tax=Microcella TaxID=337004 RepID=UPI0015CF6FC8|nr:MULTISPECIES: LCP family protein [Microcella]QOD93794.1 LCP family protein [Chryseoglobus sp. 28M-23]